MTIPIKRRDPQIAENKGQSIHYQLAIPGRVDKGYQRFQSGNGKTAQGVLDDIGSIIETRQRDGIRKDLKAGKVWAESGNELVPGEEYSEKFRESFWTSKGHRESSEFTTEMHDYLSKNPNAPKEVVKEHLEGIFKSRMAGKNDAYISGFAPAAYDVMNRGIAAHTTRQNAEILKEDLLNKGVEMRDLLKHAEEPEDVRLVLNSFQATGKEAGYSRKQINDLFLKQLTDHVIELGTEEALLLFEVKNIKDPDGIRLRDVGDMGGDFIGAYNKAVRELDRKEARFDRERKKNREEAYKEGITLMHGIRTGKVDPSELQTLLDTKDLGVQSVQVFTKFLADEELGLNRRYDEWITRDVIAAATTSDPDDDFTEQELTHFYLEGQISPDTYAGAMKKIKTKQSPDFRSAYNSDAAVIVRKSLEHLKHFVYGVNLEGLNSSDKIITYNVVANNDFNDRLVEELDNEGKITSARVREIGREIRDYWQEQAEKSKKSPIRMLFDVYDEEKPDEFFELYRYFSGDPEMSIEQIGEEIIMWQNHLFPPPQPTAAPEESPADSSAATTEKPQKWYLKPREERRISDLPVVGGLADIVGKHMLGRIKGIRQGVNIYQEANKDKEPTKDILSAFHEALAENPKLKDAMEPVTKEDVAEFFKKFTNKDD